MLAAIPEAPGTCRRILRAALCVYDLAALADDAETVVTELASNAVRAMRAEEAAGRLGGDVPVIALALGWRENGVRIEVWDRAPGRPRLRAPDWEAEQGRGLFLVDQVTDGRWGYHTAGDAKCVWAELAQRMTNRGKEGTSMSGTNSTGTNSTGTGAGGTGTGGTNTAGANTTGTDATTEKMRLAVNALLSEPDEISDGLEAELYALRDRLDITDLARHTQPGSAGNP